MDNAVVIEYLEHGYNYRHNKYSDEAEELKSDIHAHDADYRRDAEVARDYLRLDYLAYDSYAGIYDNESDSESVAAVYQREHRAVPGTHQAGGVPRRLPRARSVRRDVGGDDAGETPVGQQSFQ